MTKIHKEIYGQGKPIVLIPGWAMHTGIWRPFAQQLALQHKVICLDLPGHGLSDAIQPYTLEKIADCLIAEIEEPSFCLLGWSLGGTVALAMADRFSNRVNSLILLAANPRFVQEENWAGMPVELLQAFANNLSENCQQTLIRFLALQVNQLSDGKVILKQIKSALQCCDSPSESILQDALEILKQSDLREQLSALQCPINIIQGDKDSLIPLQTSVDIKKIQPASQINIIAEAGHVPFLSHPAQLINLINNFI